MKCPLCGEKLEIDDIDYRFEGNEDIYALCPKCHHTFEFYIRFHKIWKYTIQEMYYDEQDKQWYNDETKPCVTKKGDSYGTRT